MNINETNSGNDLSNESFELLELLGSGGFAHTYKATVTEEDLIEDYKTNVVALKIPLNKQKERVLRREILRNGGLWMSLKEVDSCNLIKFFDFTIFRGQNVMVMEYAPGSLRDKIGKLGRQKPVKVSDAIKIAKGILNGLIVLHRRNIFHRDIKPENVLGMKSGGIPKIADLGIARMLDSNELASTTTGTIFYMSPEILSEDGASFKSDVWSLGVTLYEMLAGRLPFGKRDTPIGRTINLICNHKQIPICEVCTEISRKLSDIVDNSLAKDPSDRYDTKEMAQALMDFEKGFADEFKKELDRIHELAEDCEQTSVVEKMCHTLVKRFPNKPEAYLHLGSFYNKSQRYSEAKKAFSDGLKLDANNELLNFYLGMVNLSLGNDKDAICCLKKLTEYGRDEALKRKAQTLIRNLGVS